MKKYLLSFFACIFISLLGTAQDIPNHISFTRIYDFMDELANDGFIELNSAVKPYSQMLIALKLDEVRENFVEQTGDKQLTKRQLKELQYFLNEYALELNQMPGGSVSLFKNKHAFTSLIPPVINYKDDYFRARITPILGMHLYYNNQGNITKRWYGAEFQGMLGKNISIYGSLRDISQTGVGPLSGPTYLNDEPGYEYTFGADFSDSRGGIKYANRYFSVGLIKDNIVWGDNYHGSNILSGRAPSIPMLYLQVKPAPWFELNYFHGWLVSNELDSTYHYLENESAIHYRPANKYMAANLFTFTPIKDLKLSIGNAIVYAERTVQPAYFIPIAFYKSIDHMLTKGLGVENQNSQLFLNISSRNIPHTHLFASVFVDEVQLRRFHPKSPDRNPISYKVGTHITNFPLKNVSLVAEYTRTNIINYKHSIPTLAYTSNSYNLGHFLGDNAQDFYAAIQYKPLRGLDFKLFYNNAKHGNEYEYRRRGEDMNGLYNGNIIDIISNPSLGDVIWSNQTFGMHVTYEVFRNSYAIIKLENSDIRGHEAASDVAYGEIRMTAQEALDRFTPAFLQGNNTTLTMGFSIGF